MEVSPIPLLSKTITVLLYAARFFMKEDPMHSKFDHNEL